MSYKTAMKKLLILLILLFGTVYIHADCAGEGLSFFPSGQTINKNSIFIIDGYARSQRIILELNKKHKIYLKCGNKKIKLIVSEIFVGQFNLTQALLKPESELESRLDYTICIDDLPEYECLKRYNIINQKYEPVTYKVVDILDNSNPTLSEDPEEIEKTLIHYSCGPSKYVVFNNPAKDSSEIIIKTTVRNVKTGKKTIYFIEPYDGKILVGHGMCSGAFVFEDEKIKVGQGMSFEPSNNFEVEFSFMDASGNLTSMNSDPIKFTRPTKETKPSKLN